MLRITVFVHHTGPPSLTQVHPAPCIVNCESHVKYTVMQSCEIEGEEGEGERKVKVAGRGHEGALARRLQTDAQQYTLLNAMTKFENRYILE